MKTDRTYEPAILLRNVLRECLMLAADIMSAASAESSPAADLAYENAIEMIKKLRDADLNLTEIEDIYVGAANMFYAEEAEKRARKDSTTAEADQG